MKARQTKRDHSKKNKNAGMSLLEVIIAVSIFSIAAIVLLQGFVTSSRINRKSNLYLEATSTAQNVMEEIKARPFEEVSLAFNYPIDLTTGESRFTFLNPQKSSIENSQLIIKEVQKGADDTYIDVRKYQPADGDDTSKVNASVISKDNGKTFEFNPNKEGKYYFQMQNVTNLHETFDVLVEFDGGKESGYRIKTSTNSEEGKNDYEAPNIARLDTKNNAFHIMKKDWANESVWNDLLDRQYYEAYNNLWKPEYEKWVKDNTTEKKDETTGKTIKIPPTQEQIEGYLKQNPEPERLSYEEVYAQTRRKLIVKLENSSEGILKVNAKYILCAYDYVKTGGSKYERMDICPCEGEHKNEIKNQTALSEIKDCFCSLESDYTTIYTAEVDTKLKNIYLFYFPNYNSTNEADPIDEIEFYNEAGIPVTLNIAKQRDPYLPPASGEEKAYRMIVDIREIVDDKDVNWNTNPGLYKGKTKLNSNLDYDISNVDKIAERERVNQMKLTYSGRHQKDTNWKTVGNMAAKNILSYNGLDDRKKTDRIYRATVKVYRQGEAANGFVQKPIVTLEGAKEN